MCSGRYPFVPTPEELRSQYEPPMPYATQDECILRHNMGPGSASLPCTLLSGHGGDCIIEWQGKKWKVTPGGVDDPTYLFPEEIRA